MVSKNLHHESTRFLESKCHRQLAFTALDRWGFALLAELFEVLLNASGYSARKHWRFPRRWCAHPMRLTPCHDEGRMTVVFSQGPGDQEKEADS